jgi:hypothetical protein
VYLLDGYFSQNNKNLPSINGIVVVSCQQQALGFGTWQEKLNGLEKTVIQQVERIYKREKVFIIRL